MNPFKDPLLEIRADGLVAVLTFKTGETSTLTKKFAHELLTLIAASTKKKPIVCTTDRSVVAVYRAAVDFGQFTDERGLTLDYSGKQFADSRGDLSARIGIGATCGLVELPDGGTWLDDRTPENTPRHTLPVLDPDAIAQALVALVDRWTEAGNIIARSVRVSRKPDVAVDDVNFLDSPELVGSDGPATIRGRRLPGAGPAAAP